MRKVEKMKNNIAVSIVVPVYNAERDLVKCLDTVVNQTLKNVEIILVDDGSTDRSGEICKEYAAKDDRIVYFYKENEGLAAARQDGMERSSGEYVGFVDSDDWLELNMYERMYEVAKQEDADVVMCGIYADEDGINPVYLEPGVYNRERIEKEILPRSLAGITEGGSNSVLRWCNWSRIYSMRMIKENNLAFDRRFRRSQDLQLTFEAALVANKYVSICDEYLYHNRTQNNGISLSRGYTKNFWPLYKPLIDRLYSDVIAYKKQDLMFNMHLCTFFFAEAVVRNEYWNSPLKKKERIKKLDELVCDDVLKNALKYVPSERLNTYYRWIYKALLSGNGNDCYKILKKFEFERDVVKPIKRFLLSNKIISSFNDKVKSK